MPARLPQNKGAYLYLSREELWSLTEAITKEREEEEVHGKQFFDKIVEADVMEILHVS